MKYLKNILLAIIMVILMIISSTLSFIFLLEIQNQNLKRKDFIVSEDMKIKDIAVKNDVPIDFMYEAFGLDQRHKDLTLKELPLKIDYVKAKMAEQYNIAVTYKKTGFLKFILWAVYLFIVFFIIRTMKLSRTTRLILFGIPIIIFGILLGYKVSPLQPVYGMLNNLIVFNIFLKPEVMGILYFLLLTILVNKFICTWGCQLGVLQDFLFRTFRNKKDTNGIIEQFKIPFLLSNSIRILFSLAFILFLFLFSFDIFDPINPFKVFNILKLGIISTVFGTFILVLSAFTYRPFCHFICPFGLLSWVFEKISIFKIRVDYSKCDDCKFCTKACPTNVMSAILNQDKIVIPDCFACNSCIDACPQKAISLSIGKRMKKSPIFKKPKQPKTRSPNKISIFLPSIIIFSLHAFK